MRKSVFASILFLIYLSFAACNSKKTQPTVADKDTTVVADTTAEEQVPDSTIYGTSTEDFGMSTFSMVTDKGDTLFVCRTSNDGQDAKIYGSVTYGQRYAMTTKDNGESLGVLINLTELNKKLKDYEIVNGKLVVKGDTVALETYFK